MCYCRETVEFGKRAWRVRDGVFLDRLLGILLQVLVLILRLRAETVQKGFLEDLPVLLLLWANLTVSLVGFSIDVLSEGDPQISHHELKHFLFFRSRIFAESHHPRARVPGKVLPILLLYRIFEVLDEILRRFTSACIPMEGFDLIDRYRKFSRGLWKGTLGGVFFFRSERWALASGE